MATTLETLATQLATALEPLRYPATDPEAIVGSLKRLGWEAPPGVDLRTLVRVDPTEVLAKLKVVLDSTEAEREDLALMAGRYADLLAAVQQLIEAIDETARNLQIALTSLPDYLQRTGIVEQLPRRAIDLLVAGWIVGASPTAYELLRLLGLILQREFPADPANFQVAHTRTIVEYARFQTLFSDPLELFVAEYGWGTAAFDARKLMERIAALALAIGFRARFRDLPLEVEELLLGKPVLEASADPSPQVTVSLTRGLGPEGFELGLAGLRLRPSAAGATDAGIAVLPYLVGAAVQSFPLTDRLTLELATELDLAGGVILELRPTGAAMRTGLAGDGAGVAGGGQVTLALRYRPPAGEAIQLLSVPGGTRVEVEELALRGGAALGADGTVDPMVELTVGGGRLVVTLAEADGFLAAILPGEPLTIAFDLVAGASGKRGVYFGGGLGFQYTVHVNQAIGPLFVTTLDLALRVDQDGLRLVVTVTGGLALGPLVAVVTGIGVEGRLRLGRAGNLGNADLAIAFRPPTGIGLSLDTPAVKAGGFLLIDAEHGRYVGAVELSVVDKFDLTAIGLITTRMPDGSEGFSLLLLISFTFPVPIPLGYNFYLAGVGGLLGLNRSVDLDRLRDGLRTGTADNVLFPTDIVRRIDAIVRDLEQSFPPAQGQFLIGPMAMITWSSPPLITAKIGLIIEIGTPVRIALLGVLRVVLPDADNPIVDLKVAFLGSIDTELGLLSFDASIYDSFIGRGDFKLSLEGDIALRVSWGRQPDFLTTVGGFHPMYRPPAHLRLPALRRLTLSLLKDNPRLVLTLYFALTTNTVQFGARLDFRLVVGSFSVVGEFGFDVLFQFSPFLFDAHVWARLSVRAGGSELLSLSLDFSLQGPTPWIARGTAKFKILFFEVAVEFERRFGEEAISTLPDVAVLPKVVEELAREASWRGELGPGATAQVQLLPPAPVKGSVVVDAGGIVTVSQKVLPFDTDFTLFGTSRPSDAQRVVLPRLSLGGQAEGTAPVTDAFAPAAFQELSDRDKLKAVAYEQRPSGVQATGNQGLRTDYVLGHPVIYEVVLSDTAAGGAETRAGTQAESAERFDTLVPGGAAGRSTAAAARRRQREAGSVLAVNEARDRFAVTTVTDLRPLGPDGMPVEPEEVDAAGRPRYAEGTLLLRSDADARQRALVDGGRDPLALQLLPEAQLTS